MLYLYIYSFRGVFALLVLSISIRCEVRKHKLVLHSSLINYNLVRELGLPFVMLSLEIIG